MSVSSTIKITNIDFDTNAMLQTSSLPYLPVDNAHPSFIPTPILDYPLKKKKGNRKLRKWLRKNSIEIS